MSDLDKELREWAEGASVQFLPSRVGVEFEKRLNELPWTDTHLDWSRLGGVKIDLRQGIQLPEGTLLGAHQEVIALLKPGMPSVVGERDMMLESLDEIYWALPGYRYICGADRDEGGDVIPAYGDLGEYDGTHLLRLRS